MKKFWKKTEGFTLVELIVVIAILGILAGVGTVGYSGYIKKANMAADQQLISDIENALTLSYYGGDLVDGSAGFLMLSPVEECIPDAEDGLTAAAMEKTFGSNWMDVMQLKYSDWGVKNQMMSHEDATTVVGSTFVKQISAEDLMGDVTAITDAVLGLYYGSGGTGEGRTVSSMFDYTDGTGNAADDLAKEFGYDNFAAVPEAERANLLVMATASSINAGQANQATTLIPEFALYTSFAAIDPGFKEKYENFQTSIQNIPDTYDTEAKRVDYIADQYRALRQAANASSAYQTYANNTAASDRSAFNAIMKGVGNAVLDNKDTIKNSLSDANMFSNGVGSELYNDYLNNAYATAGSDPEVFNEIYGALRDGAFPGAILVQYSVVDGRFCVVNSMSV